MIVGLVVTVGRTSACGGEVNESAENASLSSHCFLGQIDAQLNWTRLQVAAALVKRVSGDLKSTKRVKEPAENAYPSSQIFLGQTAALLNCTRLQVAVVMVVRCPSRGLQVGEI